jgi:hypothetical protein
VCVAECCLHGAWKCSDGDRRVGVSPAAIGERECCHAGFFGGDRGGWRAGALRRRSWLLVSGATAVASGSAEAASTSGSDRGCCCAGSLLWCAGVLASGRRAGVLRRRAGAVASGSAAAASGSDGACDRDGWREWLFFVRHGVRGLYRLGNRVCAFCAWEWVFRSIKH